MRLVLALAVTLAAAGPAAASTILDYITFDGIDYIRWAEEPGRALTRDDLGMEFAVIECSFGEDLRGCPFGVDASAAFLPAGTRIHAVRGHATSFRLAALWKDRIFLYQAWRNPRAKTGGDLWALAGKVRRIEVQLGQPVGDTARMPIAIEQPDSLGSVLAIIARAPTRREQPHAYGEPCYWLTFWLTDGTTFERPYYPEDGELMGGVTAGADLRGILERYLTAPKSAR